MIRIYFENFKAKIQSFATRNNWSSPLLLLIIVLLAAVVLFLRYQFVTKGPTTHLASGNYLSLVEYSPIGSVRNPQQITLRFSDAVDIHQLEHYLTISPDVPGKLVKGNSAQEFFFVPEGKFPGNTYFSVTIGGGLTSKNRKPFIDDYYFYFNTESSTNEVIFKKDGVFGRVLSFSMADPVTVTVDRSTSNFGKISVSIYNSTQAQLLNYLLYKSDKTMETYYTYPSEGYINKSIDHSKDQLLKTRQMNEKEITMDETLDQKPGIYYLEARDEENNLAGSSFVLVNKTGIVFRQDDQKVVLAAFDLNSGKKIADKVDAAFYNLADTPNQLSIDSFIELERGFSIPFSKRVDAVIATINGESIFVPVRLPLSLADLKVTSDLEQDSKIFVYTERPIYKPGDTVFFRGILRTDSDSLYKVPEAGKTIYIQLGYGRENPFKMEVTTDAHGVFFGNFIAKNEWVGGNYLYASTAQFTNDNYYRSASATFDVVEYKKPDFELSVEVNKSEYLRHEKPKFTISGKFFSGKPMTGEEIEYTSYTQDFYETEKAVYNQNFNLNAQGGMCGGGGWFDYYGQELEEAKKIKLDKNGKAVVELPDDPKAILSQKITLVAKKNDKNGNEIVGASNTIQHASSYNIFYLPSAIYYKVGEEVVAPFYAETLAGDKLAGQEFTYKFVASSGYDSGGLEKVIESGKVVADDSGKAIIRFMFPKQEKNEGSRYILVEGTDQQGNKVQVKKNLYIKAEEESVYRYWSGDVSQTYLKIVSAKNSFKVGDNIILTVSSPEELDALVTFERGRVYEPQIVRLNKGDTTIAIPVTADLSPSITPVFSFFTKGKYYTEGLSLNVPAMHRLLSINLSAERPQYKVGETALLKVTTRDSNGAPVVANLSLGIVDKAIYALSKDATPAVHSSFYYFRPRRTNASSSLTWVGSYGGKGGGGGGGGGNIVNKTVDTLYWNPNLVTDTHGEATVAVPLGKTETIWKAQVMGSTDRSEVGQADAEFLVTK